MVAQIFRRLRHVESIMPLVSGRILNLMEEFNLVRNDVDYNMVPVLLRDGGSHESYRTDCD